jgi:ATP-dependent Clp protease ATP-binding subunit ClpA
MNIEKYTERARGFIQSAQSLAMRDGHQQFSPLHMLKVLLDDSEGLAGGLIDRAGGNSRAILKATEDALNKLPKVSGSGAGQVYLAPMTSIAGQRPSRSYPMRCRLSNKGATIMIHTHQTSPTQFHTRLGSNATHMDSSFGNFQYCHPRPIRWRLYVRT